MSENKVLLTTGDLIQDYKEAKGIGASEAKKDIDFVISSVIDALAQGKKVRLQGLGTFEVRHRNERVGRNPKTGEEITVPASEYIGFSQASTIKKIVNGDMEWEMPVLFETEEQVAEEQ